MNGHDALRLMRKFISDERSDAFKAYNRGLAERDYMQMVGRMKQLELIEAKLNQLLKMKGDDDE